MTAQTVGVMTDGALQQVVGQAVDILIGVAAWIRVTEGMGGTASVLRQRRSDGSCSKCQLVPNEARELSLTLGLLFLFLLVALTTTTRRQIGEGAHGLFLHRT